MQKISRVPVLAFVALFGFTALAQQGPGPDSTQPPVSDEVVAHLSAISGNISTARSDTGDWVTGAINTPLVSGDQVAAGAGSRAEVQIDYADLLRLGDNASVTLSKLTKTSIQVQLGAGLADYVVLKGAQATSEIDTPNIAIYPQGPGVYRVLVSSNNETQVIVRKGEAEISTPQGSTRIKQGEQINVEGVEAPQYKVSSAPPNDAWDQWNSERNHAVEVAGSYDHANRYYTGVQALDGYGYWTTVPGYGAVWVPNEGPGWSPYSNGRWTWEPYWGWTWVAYDPWGWAPYHYGRWFVYGPSWVWWPGPVTPYYRPLWAPAYVSFFGWGGGFGVGVGFGSIGWMPIGPGDYYRPWWGGWNHYSVNYVNITNITVINNVERRRAMIAPLAVASHERVVYSNLASLRTNARVRDGLIRVPSSHFAQGGMTARSHVTVAELHSGSVLGGTLPVVPTHASLGASRVQRPGYRPAQVPNHFFGQRGTVMARPTFTEERANLQHELRGTPATVRTARPGVAPTQPRHFTSEGSLRQPAAQPKTVQPENNPSRETRPTPRARQGWQSFNHNPVPRNAEPQLNQPRVREPRTPAPRVTPQQQALPHPVPQREARPHTVQPQAQPQHPSRPANGPGNGWQSFREQPRAEPQARSFEPRESPPRQAYRPPLQVGHPIVTAPREPSYRPEYRAPAYRRPENRAPSYHAPAYRAPSYRAPQYHAPSYHSAPAPHGSAGHPGGGHPH